MRDTKLIPNSLSELDIWLFNLIKNVVLIAKIMNNVASDTILKYVLLGI